jgi:hypothetical protein
MFRLFTRPAGRPRTVRPQVRTRLRLETLEARANPAAPILQSVRADWGDEHFVVISGMVQDETPGQAVIHVAGAVQANGGVGEGGQFAIALKLTGTGPVYVRAGDTEGLYSGMLVFHYGDPAPAPGGNQPLLSDVSIIRDENGLWHIHGHVDNTSPIGTIIRVISGPGDSPGQTGTVDVDGNFDIVLDVPDGSSGAISIIAINQDKGDESDPWDGFVG